MQSKLKELFDYSDGHLIWKTSNLRGFNKTGKSAGTINKGYLWVRTKLIDGKAKVYGLNRLVWIWHNSTIPTDMVVDHIDRNPMNNRIENLRLASSSKNAMNASGKSTRKCLLPKNVYVDYTYGEIVKYRAQICKNGVVHRVGGFDTSEQANEAAKALRFTKHREFAHG